MKRIFVLLCFFMCLSYLNAQNTDEEKIRTFVANILRTYPKSTLADVYKSSFQDFFGPEHLVENKESILNYLEKELSYKEELGLPYYEFCGTEGRFVRVYLSVIKDSIISKEELADAFVRSSKMINKNINDWQTQWRKQCNVVVQMNLNLENFQQDSLYIENLISKGRYAWVHSRTYHSTYHPHYRIIEREIFFKEIFPKILQRAKR